jgi:molecular chaperone DnaK (HSP70)
MVADAEKYKDDDDKVKLLIEAKNNLENYVYSMENVVNDEKMKLGDEDKNKVTEKIEEIKSWLYTNSDNITDYENKQKELEEIVKPIMEKMGAGNGMPEDIETPPTDIPLNESENEPSIEEID